MLAMLCNIDLSVGDRLDGSIFLQVSSLRYINSRRMVKSILQRPFRGRVGTLGG